MKALLRHGVTAAPFLIIGGLLYAGLFIKPASVGQAVARPAFERGDRLYGLAIQPNGKTWLVGSHGKILAGDGASDSQRWRIVEAPVQGALQDVAAWDDRHLVAVGDDATVVVSQDGGQQWRTIPVPRNAVANKLLRLATAAQGRAWAVGEGGALLVTADHGQTWQALRAGEDIAWNDVAVRDDRGWVVGEKGRILVSADGGTTWREVKSPVKTSLMAVAFRNARDGVAVGLDGVVLVSRDGGESWQEAGFASPDSEPAQAPASATVDAAKALERGRTEHLLRVLWTGDRWLAMGTKGVLAVGSEDGLLWHGTRLSEQDRSWYTAAAVHQGQLLLAGSRFVTSPLTALAAAKPAQ